MTNCKYFLGLGSNIEPRIDHLRMAIERIASIGEVVECSSIYETQAWGEKRQDSFLNLALLLKSDYPATELLVRLKKIEKQIGRLETYRWGPRKIDIDILLGDDLKIKTADLQIPHKYFKLRKFVLLPLKEIAPDLVPVGESKTITALLATCSDTSQIEKHRVQL